LATEMLLDPKSQVSGFVDLTCLGKMLGEHKAGAYDFSNELWGLLVLEYWFQAFEVRL
jgi:hypothetical protein